MRRDPVRERFLSRMPRWRGSGGDPFFSWAVPALDRQRCGCICDAY